MAITLILLAGFIFRVVSINQSLWLDEATTALVSKMTIVDMFTKFLPADFHPPLYYLILKFWTFVFGYSEISLRMPSVFFGLGIVFLVYKITKLLFGGNSAKIAAFLSATSGLLIYYSQEARMYSMAAFLITLSIYLFLQKKWIYFSIVLVLIGMTDYVSLLILPIFWIVGRKNIRELIISHIPLVIGFGLWIPTFLTQLGAGFSVADSAWGKILGPTTVKNVGLIPVKFVLGRISFDDKALYLIIALLSVSLFCYLLWMARKSNKIIWLWLVLPLVFGILLSFKIPTLSYFRFLFCLPALYILSANALENNKFHKKVLILAIFGINLFSSGYYLINNRFQREDWREAVSFIESTKTPQSATLFVTGSNWEAYRYYAPDAKIAIPSQIDGSFDQIWLMRYVWEIFDPTDSTRHKIERLGYKKLEEYNFNGISVYQYKK